MAYTELIKNFNRIRDYMREFYVYGFKSREEYTKKSARSYDDERRRLESWLGENMKFHQTPDGKNVFISIDSRKSQHNPLYQAWKAKSFTDGDITLHFILLDILQSAKGALTLHEITTEMDQYLSEFQNQRTFDDSTIRKKLNEYISEGIVIGQKQAKTMYYKKAELEHDLDEDMLNFFSEVAPCGVIGSFLLDRIEAKASHFVFKHHYITGAMDSEILCIIFQALRQKRSVILKIIRQKNDSANEIHVVPLRVMISVQNGRQYLMAYNMKYNRITSYRLDYISSVKIGEINLQFDEFREKLNKILPHIWGVSTQGRSSSRMEHVEFLIRYKEWESYIPNRLEREKRCGTVTHFDNHTSKFEADVYDASELIPWIRTFLCRITEIHFSNEALEKQFRNDIKEMYRIYGMEGGETCDI